jgi:hypothetical protein
MNNFLLLALAPWSQDFCSERFFRRTLVDGAQGRFLQITGALVSRQHVAADGNCPRWILFCRTRRLATAGDLSARIYHRAIHRDAADPNANRASALNQRRRPAMRLSPDQLIFWQHGFFKLNGTIVFTWGLMLVLAVGSKSSSRANFPRI